LLLRWTCPIACCYPHYTPRAMIVKTADAHGDQLLRGLVLGAACGDRMREFFGDISTIMDRGGRDTAGLTTLC
jgi:hypothetical protein